MVIAERIRKYTKKPKVKKTKKGKIDLRDFEDKWSWCAVAGGDNPGIEIEAKLDKEGNWTYV